MSEDEVLTVDELNALIKLMELWCYGLNEYLGGNFSCAPDGRTVHGDDIIVGVMHLPWPEASIRIRDHILDTPRRWKGRP